MAETICRLQACLKELHLLNEAKVIAHSSPLERNKVVPRDQLNQAAVLFLVHCVDGKLNVLLTKRSVTVERSPGEICLPGGHLEVGETHICAALRETQEEVGISKEHITVVGPLPAIISEGRKIITVTPIVGVLHPEYNPNELELCPREVESAFWVPLDLFLSSTSHKNVKWCSPVKPFVAYFLNFFLYSDPMKNSSHWIWGLTANVCILASCVILDRIPPFPYTYFYYDKSESRGNSVCLTLKPISMRLKSVL